jgi:hypothetical protein
MFSNAVNYPNKYSGECVYCHNTVPAGFGFYNGSTSCADLVEVEDGYGLAEVTCKNAEGALINFFTSKKYIAGREAIKQAAEKRRADIAQAKKDRVVATKKLKAEGKCTRCGGAGRSDNWIATGSVCFKCDGTGKSVK